jgi:hypothetical protein
MVKPSGHGVFLCVSAVCGFRYPMKIKMIHQSIVNHLGTHGPLVRVGGRLMDFKFKVGRWKRAIMFHEHFIKLQSCFSKHVRQQRSIPIQVTINVYIGTSFEKHTFTYTTLCKVTTYWSGGPVDSPHPWPQ